MPIFRVGAENGGKEAGDATSFMHKALNNVFFFDPKLVGYFKSVEFFILALRVSGKTKDFGGEGPEYLKKVRGKNLYAIDLTVPEDKWKDVPFDDLRLYMVESVKQCFELCVAKARAAIELRDEAKLRADFEAGIREILDANEYDDIFCKSRGLDILNSMIAECEKTGKSVDKQAFMKKIELGIFTV